MKRPSLPPRRLLLGAAAGSVAVLAAVGIAVATPDGTRPEADPAATSAVSSTAAGTAAAPGGPAGTATATPPGTPPGTPPWTPPPAPATPVPSGPTEDATALPAALPAVPLRAPAAVGDGVTASLTSLEAVQGTATGPGNVDGPALRVTVSLTNGTGTPVALDGAVVDLAYGPDAAPAPRLDDPTAAPFAGTLAPGESASAVYVFSVPADARDQVTVSVGYQAGAPLMTFTGSAS